MTTTYKYAEASTGKTTIGRYAFNELQFNSNPVDGNTLTITWNGVSREYTFSSSGGANKHSLNPPATRTCLIGATKEETIENLVVTIHSNVHDVTTGEDTTISTSAKDDRLFIYSNAKIAGSVVMANTGGFVQSVNGQAGANVDLQDDLPFTAFLTTQANPTVVVADPDADGYNPGPPNNKLIQKALIVPANTFVTLRVWGISTAGTLFR